MALSHDREVMLEYRRVGNTDLNVSEIGFGCGGNAGLMVRGSAGEQRRAVGRAIELGINYFDTAPDYGDGAAEENLGRALKALALRPVITSKVEVRHADLGDIAAHVARSTEGSLKRLGVDCVDILQIHNGPTRHPPALQGRSYTHLWIDDYLRPGGALDGLQRMVQHGKARYLGFICRGDDGEQVRQLLDTRQFQMINVPYTLLNPTAAMGKPDGLEVERDFGAVIPAAEARGVGTAIYSPLAGGFLTQASVAGEHGHPLARRRDRAAPSYHRHVQMARALRFLAQEGGDTLAQAAVRFILMTRGVSVVLGGFSALCHLEDSASISGTGPLAPELMARVEAVWRDNFGLPASSSAT